MKKLMLSIAAVSMVAVGLFAYNTNKCPKESCENQETCVCTSSCEEGCTKGCCAQ